MKHLLLFIGLAACFLRGTAQTIINPFAIVGRAPQAITFDHAGNLYAVNTSSSTAGGTISKIASDGTVTILWATVGTSPSFIFCDGSDNLYTINSSLPNPIICKITPGGTVTTFASLGNVNPHKATMDPAGNMYVATYNNGSNGPIIKITPDGTIINNWATVAPYSTSITIDHAGNLYTANETDNSISKVTPDGTATAHWAMVSGNPYDIIVDASGNLYTANINGNSVSKISANGEVNQNWAVLPVGSRPRTLAIDRLGNLYTANSANSTISKITPGGTVTANWAKLSETNIYLQALAIDKGGNVYTANQYENAVIKIIPPVIRTNKGVLYVDGSAVPGGDGSSWNKALTTLQDALNATDTLNKSGVDSVHQIWVAKGTYQAEAGLSFSMRPKLKIYGSFAGSEASPAERVFSATDTSILLGNGASVVRNDQNGLDTSACLDGFKITGGTALGNSGNSQYGGGIYNRGSSPGLNNIVISGNTAADIGGGMLNDNGASPVLHNVIFSNNSGGRRGGGGLADFSGSNATLENVLFFNNEATSGDGGAIYNSNSTTRLINTTISSNKASGQGGGFYNTGGSGTPVITNSILWNNSSSSNTGHEIANTGASIPTLTNSIYQNDPDDISGTITVNTGSLTIDPLFADPANANYHLTAFSQGIDAGDNSALSENNSQDLDHQQRIYNQSAGGKVDIGAYEFQAEAIHAFNGILYIDSAAEQNGNGSSWAKALSSFADGLSAAKAINKKGVAEDSVRQIWVAKGTYQPASGTSFSMLPKVKIYGSFAGNETTLTQRNLAGSDTSILRGNGHRVITNNNNQLDSSAVLDGFKITGGKDNVADQNGAGILNNEHTSPTYSHLVITDNHAIYWGGGMTIIRSPDIRLNDIVIRDNTSQSSGAGIMILSSDVELNNALIVRNTAKSIGGGIQLSELAQVTLNNTTISGNTATQGGGIQGTFSPATDCIFKLNNSIIWGNKATDNIANEIYIADPSRSSSYSFNHTLFKNEVNDLYISIATLITYSQTLNVSPQFVDSINSDYHLGVNSPAIDAGDNTLKPADVVVDIAGNARVVNQIVDLGAYEYQGGTLPVELDSFAGQLQNHLLSIGWKTGVESNLDHYEIEKSTDARSFTFLAEIAAKGSNKSYFYQGIQQEPAAYYRLKSVDNDGRVYYSEIIALYRDNSIANSVFLYPNPAKNYINISTKSAGTLRIYSVSGAKVKDQSLKAGINSIDILHLSAGIYFAVINGQRIKFIKR